MVAARVPDTTSALDLLNRLHLDLLWLGCLSTFHLFFLLLAFLVDLLLTGTAGLLCLSVGSCGLSFSSFCLGETLLIDVLLSESLD